MCFNRYRTAEHHDIIPGGYCYEYCHAHRHSTGRSTPALAPILSSALPPSAPQSLLQRGLQRVLLRVLPHRNSEYIPALILQGGLKRVLRMLQRVLLYRASQYIPRNCYCGVPRECCCVYCHTASAPLTCALSDLVTPSIGICRTRGRYSQKGKGTCRRDGPAAPEEGKCERHIPQGDTLSQQQEPQSPSPPCRHP